MKLFIKNINKKIFIYLISFLTGSIILSSCKKDFLNDPKPTDQVSTKDVFASADGVRAYFNGIYRNIRAQWQSLDGSAGGVDDTYSFEALNLTRVAKGTDIVMAFPTFFIYDYQYQNREPTYRRTLFTWEFPYENINQFNILIKGVEESSALSEDDKKLFTAEARALRAWFYFELIREFQLSINKDPNAPGVPIYTEPTSIENKGKPRGTIKETYDQINSDIEYATQNIGDDRSLKAQVNSNVAWGMAARIYLEQNRWADAENAAQKAREGLDLDPAGYTSNYNDLTSSEVIWGFPQTTDGGQSLYYGTQSSFFEQTGAGYDGFYMSEEFVHHFSATDVRNTFYEYDAPGTPDHYATNKFGSDSKDYQVPLINGQTVALKELDFNESQIMMRVGEMYLIEAEAKARQGKADAGDVLYELQVNRDPQAVKSGNTGDALIKEILLERRKELYGEIGVEFLDAKRLQLPLDRTGSNHESPNNFVIPANDPLFTLKIPQKEIDSNDSISEADQNL